MALLMPTRRAAAASRYLGRIFSRESRLSSAAPPSTSRFIRYFSVGNDCTITAYGNCCKRSDKFAVNPGILDPHIQKPFQTSGPKSYEVKQVQEGLFMRMEMPGIDKNDVKVLVENEDTFLVKGEGKKESPYEENGRAYNFRVKIPPHHSMIHQNMKAEMKNGVLRMMIPNTNQMIEAEIENNKLKVVEGDQGKGGVLHDESTISSQDVETQEKEEEMNGGVEIPKPMNSQKYQKLETHDMKAEMKSGTDESQRRRLETFDIFLIFLLISILLPSVCIILFVLVDFVIHIRDFIFRES